MLQSQRRGILSSLHLRLVKSIRSRLPRRLTLYLPLTRRVDCISPIAPGHVRRQARCPCMLNVILTCLNYNVVLNYLLVFRSPTDITAVDRTLRDD